jgi:hypothetical protein
VSSKSAAVPQPGRDSINGDVDSLHELVVRRDRIGWSRPMAPEELDLDVVERIDIGKTVAERTRPWPLS